MSWSSLIGSRIYTTSYYVMFIMKKAVDSYWGINKYSIYCHLYLLLLYITWVGATWTFDIIFCLFHNYFIFIIYFIIYSLFHYSFREKTDEIEYCVKIFYGFRHEGCMASKIKVDDVFANNNDVRFDRTESFFIIHNSKLEYESTTKDLIYVT